MNVIELIKHALLSLGASPVMWLMLGLSVVSLSLVLERAWFFARIRADIAALAQGLSERLRVRDLDGARALLAASPSAEAAVVRVGLCETAHGSNAVREAIAGALLLQRARLERGLGFLGSLASNAPFIGLFGTVIGIILAFDHMGRAGAGNSASAAVMASIAEALVATAVGIGIAVPAIVAFNVFQQRIRVIVDQTNALGHVLLSQLEGERSERQQRANALLCDATDAFAQQTCADEEI